MKKFAQWEAEKPKHEGKCYFKGESKSRDIRKSEIKREVKRKLKIKPSLKEHLNRETSENKTLQERFNESIKENYNSKLLLSLENQNL